MTKQEIIALQNELGVTPDGIIGPQTRAAAAAKIQGSVSIAEAQALKSSIVELLSNKIASTKILNAA